jgi:hypothetical protein
LRSRSAELTGALRVGDHICVVNDTVVGTMGSLKDGVTMNMVTDLLAGPEDSTVEIGADDPASVCCLLSS